MGVMGTFCQICAMPVQHNGYVPYQGMYYIYRGPKSSPPPDDPGRPFDFGPEQDWLLDAIALRLDRDEEPQILAGEVQDGGFEEPDDDQDCFLGDGLEDRAALHRCCWELAGSPEFEALAGIAAGAAWQDLTRYHEQLFNFEALVADGRAWMLSDPRSSSPEAQKNRQRILALIQGGLQRSEE